VFSKNNDCLIFNVAENKWLTASATGIDVFLSTVPRLSGLNDPLLLWTLTKAADQRKICLKNKKREFFLDGRNTRMEENPVISKSSNKELEPFEWNFIPFEQPRPDSYTRNLNLNDMMAYWNKRRPELTAITQVYQTTEDLRQASSVIYDFKVEFNQSQILLRLSGQESSQSKTALEMNRSYTYEIVLFIRTWDLYLRLRGATTSDASTYAKYLAKKLIPDSKDHRNN
jgi:uncharacterized protein YfdQ (DUF2303 family)